MTDDHPAMWNVFISHSTNGANGVAKRILERLEKALPSTYRPMVDHREIGAGDDWEKWIINGLRQAHIGIVLLDKHAAESKWVQLEANFLATRPEASARLFPVVIGISRALIRNDRKYAEYRRLLHEQTIQVGEPEGEAAINAEADRVCEKIMERLVEFSDGLYREDLRLIRDLTATFDLHEDEAKRLTEEHFHEPIDDTKFRPFFPEELLAKRLLDAQLSEPAVSAVKDLLFSPSRLHRARTIVLSSWITWPEARPIRSDDQEPGSRTPVLRSDNTLVAEQFVHRANGCVPSSCDSIPLDPDADGEVTSVVQLVDELFAPREGPARLRCSAGADGKCFHARYPKHVLVKVVGSLELSAKVAEEIHRRCPSIVVLLLISPSVYDKRGESQIRGLLGKAYRSVGPIDEERQRRFLATRYELCRTFERNGESR